uniref:Uncharacterized protein n=1 Tax=Arundo donax TaxID=35708 RepID=A0A0A9AV10_ARUDO
MVPCKYVTVPSIKFINRNRIRGCRGRFS